tara:strand:+ start:5735 stop:5947 length:213 start_codon:yes stop_codon:yes gene_type:complete
MITKIILIVLSTLLTFPLAHIFMKKGMIMDYNLNEEKQKDLGKFFYIPYLNIIISFFYLVWVIIKFKKPG